MMPSELENLDRAWEMTVLPHPNAPGIAHVPPSTDGNRPSSTRCPVNRGVDGSSLRATGRGARTGQADTMAWRDLTPFSSSSSTSSPIVYVPGGATYVTTPAALGGTMSRCSSSVFSGTAA